MSHENGPFNDAFWMNFEHRLIKLDRLITFDKSKYIHQDFIIRSNIRSLLKNNPVGFWVSQDGRSRLELCGHLPIVAVYRTEDVGVE